MSSWADQSLIEQVRRRDYRPEWFRNVFVAETANAADGHRAPTSIEIVAVDETLIGTWLDVLYEGVGDKTAAARAVSDEFGRARLDVPHSASFVAWLDGEPAGCGTVECDGGVAWCGAAATVSSFARRGVHAELLRHRFGWARRVGCDLVAATALPSGISARNLLRHRLELAYVQVVMSRVSASNG